LSFNGFGAGLTDAPITIRGGVARTALWPSCRNPDRARRPGASPPMRMAASWCGSQRSPAYKIVARSRAPDRQAPL